jgi:small subunit ribosomal protein S21
MERACAFSPFNRYPPTETKVNPVQVLVRENNVDQALRVLKKKMQREGIFRELKLRGQYEKPSEKRAREKAEAVRRARKLARKRAEREGGVVAKPRPSARSGAPGGRSSSAGFSGANSSGTSSSGGAAPRP